MRKLKRIIALTLLSCTLFSMHSTEVNASSTKVDITIDATTVDLNVPINIQCVLNPNAENEEDRFTHGDLHVTNNSLAPVKIFVSSITDTNNTFTDIITEDGLPNDKSWDTLSAIDSDKYFALSAVPTTGWSKVDTNKIEMATITGTTPVGSLVNNATGKLDLDAKFGLSQRQEKNFQFNMVLIGDLNSDMDIPETSQSLLNYNISETYGNTSIYDGKEISGEVTITSLSDEGVSQDLAHLNIPEIIVIDDKNYIVTSIGDNAFDSTTKEGCSNISALILPNTVEAIGVAAFADLYKVTDVIIPNSCKTIANYAFVNCTGIRTVELRVEDSTLLTTGYRCFNNLSDGAIIYVADNNFMTNRYLGDIINNSYVLPLNSEKKIINTWDAGNSVVATLYTENGRNYFTFTGTGSIDDIDDNIDVNQGTLNMVYPEWKSTLDKYKNIECRFGEGITYIGNRCLLSCDTISSVDIAGSVREIGIEAFRNVGMDNIKLNEGTESIKYGAFMLNCFEYVNLPSTLTEVDCAAFSTCRDLKSITIPSGVTEIPHDLFKDCKSLRGVIMLGTSAKTFGNECFSGTSEFITVITESADNKTYIESNADGTFIPATANVKLYTECSPYYEVARKSVWVWDTNIVTSYDELLSFIEQYDITDVYQAFDTTLLTDESNHSTVANYISALNDAGVRVWAVNGAPENAVNWIPNATFFESILGYNNSAQDSKQLIAGAQLDDEIHCISDFDMNIEDYLTKYELATKHLSYLSQYRDLQFNLTVNSSLLDSHPSVSKLYNSYASGITVMNYTDDTYINTMQAEVNEAKKLNKPIESTFDVATDGTGEGNCTSMDIAISRNKEIAEHYKYDGLGFSYHYYPNCIR